MARNESRYNKIYNNAVVNFDEITQKFLRSVDDSFGALEVPPPPPQKKEKRRAILPIDLVNREIM